jgi:hypothetical protein
MIDKILVLFILILLQIITLKLIYNKYKIYINDIKYNTNAVISDIKIKNLDKNKRIQPINKKNSILIITYDNRSNEPYIIEHNKNYSKYAKKYNLEYKFISKCTKNVYWCKLYLVYEALISNKYDYVMWVDSDTMILDFNFDLNNLVNSYDCHMLFTDDNILNLINAGVFIIKNSDIGKNYIKTCLANDLPECVDIKTNKLKGMWASTCYEQGIMNIILEKYKENNKIFTIIPLNIFYNGNNLNDINNSKILHYYGTTSEERLILFSKINKQLGII